MDDIHSTATIQYGNCVLSNINSNSFTLSISFMSTSETENIRMLAINELNAGRDGHPTLWCFDRCNSE